MDSVMEFLRMGGYAFYVWSSYALVALALALTLWLPIARGRRLRHRLRRQLAASDNGASGERGAAA